MSPTEEELAAATIDINYEVRQLVHAAQTVQHGSSPREEDTERLALEAFLLHYRNIRDFLAEPPEQDDMAAEHFCKDWVRQEWPDHLQHPRRREERSPYTEKAQIDKRLSHLTYLRAKLRQQQLDASWPVSKMCATVQQEFSRFTKQLPPDRRNWLHEAENVLARHQAKALVVGEISASTASVSGGSVLF